MDEFEISERLHYLRTAPITSLERSLMEAQTRDPDFDPWANPYIDPTPYQVKRENIPEMRRVLGSDVVDRLLARPTVEVI